MFRNQHIHSNHLTELILSKQQDTEKQCKDQMMRCTWNNNDRSINSCVMADGVIFHREPIAYYTDAIRGRICFEDKINVWKIRWAKHERGTHAMVGVATDQMPLQAEGYVQLVGSEQNSWGFDLVDKTLHHNGKSIDMSNSENKFNMIGEEVIVILDMDSGTLCFASEQGECLGVAFDGLKRKKLYPAISSVWGQCNVAIQFLGTIESQPPSLLAACRQTIRNSMTSSESIQYYHQSLPSRLIEYVYEV